MACWFGGSVLINEHLYESNFKSVHQPGSQLINQSINQSDFFGYKVALFHYEVQRQNRTVCLGNSSVSKGVESQQRRTLGSNAYVSIKHVG